VIDEHLRWTVGEVSIKRVEERVVALETAHLVPGITPAIIAEQRPWASPFVTADDRLLVSLHSFVIEGPNGTIVVDTCVGPSRGRPLPGDDEFPDRLDSAIDGGLAAVDFVLCTHLHFDHVGWNTLEVDGRFTPLFPSARYLVSAVELGTLDENDRHGIRETSIDPLLDAGVMDVVDMDHRIDDEVRLLPTPGHTEGHVSVAIESLGARALITGDAFHTPLQFSSPHLAATPFDSDSEQSTETRIGLIKNLINSDVLVLGTHFPPPTGGRVMSDAAGEAWFGPASPAERTSREP
jgi:glyoxylase-like metal-dependent hydrolase (beta-lactamase superfamily II)